MRLPVLGLLAICAAAVDNNWPQFRGPAASGVASGPAPIEWNGETGRNIQWKRPIPGLGHSSPVIWGERLFLTTAVSSISNPELRLGLYGDIKPVDETGEQKFVVYCLDRTTGKTIWERTAVSRQPQIKRHPKSTHANPTVATDGKHVAAFFGSEGLYVYDMNGKLLWQKDLGLLDSGYFQVPSAQYAARNEFFCTSA